jgi:hypothetical protein
MSGLGARTTGAYRVAQADFEHPDGTVASPRSIFPSVCNVVDTALSVKNPEKVKILPNP